MAWLGAVLFAVCIGAAPARTQKAEDTLRITWRDAVPDLDPYRNTLRTGLVIAHHVWDGLVYRDPETFQIKPLLATRWRAVDDTTMEFELRRGVFFHDGAPFLADDVVATVASILADPALAVPSNFGWLAGAERIDDTHVRLKLRRIFPAALEYIAMVMPILPKGAREDPGAGRLPVGSGPYRITEAGGDKLMLERFEGYYEGSPKGRPAIRRIAIREVQDPAEEMDDLLAGRADWIWQFNSARYNDIARRPDLQVVQAESMRIGYLSMDAAGRSGHDNPMTKVKVRQAISFAIDRPTIARTIIGNGSRVPEAPCYPTQFGCDPSFAVRFAYDPARARSLLAEAGYPGGFRTSIISYVLPEVTAAVVSNLSAVGILAEVHQLPTAAAVERIRAGEAPLSLGTWGSYSINDVSAILPVFFGGGPEDYARNPELQALLEQAGDTTNPDKRRGLYAQAIKLITEQALWLPLHTYVTNYGFSRSLSFRPNNDELPRFYLASWR
jgi:peptide/nickel transport system substrate-binding protein